MFMPHNRDPDRFHVPTAWRKADVEAEMNRLRTIPVTMPTAEDIKRSMGATQTKAEQLYNEFADYAAQRLAEYDRRDREHLDRIAASVEESMAKMRMAKIEQNDDVYISMHAPPHFRSCTMFNKDEKRARMQEMLRDSASYKERVHEIRQMNLQDLPIRKGFVAEAVTNLQAKQEEQELSKKRSHRALDGAASSPAAKRTAKQRELA